MKRERVSFFKWGRKRVPKTNGRRKMTKIGTLEHAHANVRVYVCAYLSTRQESME